MTGMGTIVRLTADLVIGFIMVFGVYIVLYGHLTPGGGFAGGLIIALGYLLLLLSDGKAALSRFFPEKLASLLESLGALGFLCIAVLGIWGGYFCLNFLVGQTGNPFDLVSAGVIPLFNIAIGLKVSSSLFLVLIALSVYRRYSSKNPLEELDEE